MAVAQYSPTQPTVARDSEPTVVQVMHRGVVTCSVDASTRSLAVLMRQHGIHHVIVVEGKEPVGVISEDDLLRAGVLGTETAGSLARRPLARTVRARAGIGQAIDMLYSGKGELLLIDNDREEPIGTLTVAEIASYMAGPAEAPADMGASAAMA